MKNEKLRELTVEELQLKLKDLKEDESKVKNNEEEKNNRKFVTR